MLNTLSSRATFYDVIGYLFPGILSLGTGWLWWYVFVDIDSAMRIARLMINHGLLATFFMLAGGYVTGHLANSISSALLEKVIFKTKFRTAKKWLDRAKSTNADRARRIEANAQTEFKVSAEALTSFDMRIRMEEKMPNATITGFSFLSFYGMSRTLALLSWLAALPVCVIIGRNFNGTASLSAAGLSCIAMIIIGGFFSYQYLRFVEYYYDFLGSTLMNVSEVKTSTHAES